MDNRFQKLANNIWFSLNFKDPRNLKNANFLFRFHNLYKKKILEIEIEYGREAPWKPSKKCSIVNYNPRLTIRKGVSH